MRVDCPACSAAYNLPPAKLKPGKRLRFSCKRCGELVVVDVPAAATKPQRRPSAVRRRPSATASAQPGPQRDGWFVAHKDAPGGYEARGLDAIRDGLATGALHEQSLVWRAGWDGWKPLGETSLAPLLRGSSVRHAARDRIREKMQGAVREDGASPRMERRAVVGLGTENTDQRAVSIPVIRAAAAAASAQDEGPAPEPASPARPAADVDEHRGGRWSPGTDTYTGNRGRHTHRIGGDSERDALLAAVAASQERRHSEAEVALRRELVVWRWATLGAVAMAVMAWTLVVMLWLDTRGG